MAPLSVSLIQSVLHWEDPQANMAMLEEKIWQLSGPVDVIVLPEMFTTGFTMNASSVAEVMGERTFRWMKQMSAQTGALLLGSFIAKENGRYFNRLLWMEPDGQFKTYDKRHLFRMANEHQAYSPGSVRLVGIWKEWRICPLVCYDLRFPVWSRNGWDAENNTMNYDLLIYVANWPSARVTQWDALLKARAIENLSYAVGVNRTGVDGLGIGYDGHSAIYGPRGEVLGFEEEKETILSATLDPKILAQYRSRFPAWMDADSFEIK